MSHRTMSGAASVDELARRPHVTRSADDRDVGRRPTAAPTGLRRGPGDPRRWRRGSRSARPSSRRLGRGAGPASTRHVPLPPGPDVAVHRSRAGPASSSARPFGRTPVTADGHVRLGLPAGERQPDGHDGALPARGSSRRSRRRGRSRSRGPRTGRDRGPAPACGSPSRVYGVEHRREVLPGGRPGRGRGRRPSPARSVLDGDLDRRRARRVLHGIGEQVQEHLLEPGRDRPARGPACDGPVTGSAEPSAGPARPRRPSGRPPRRSTTSSRSSSWPRLDPADTSSSRSMSVARRWRLRQRAARRTSPRLRRLAGRQVALDELEVVVDRRGRRLELVAGGRHQPLEAEPHRPLRDVADRDDAAPRPVLARQRLGRRPRTSAACRRRRSPRTPSGTVRRAPPAAGATPTGGSGSPARSSGPDHARRLRRTAGRRPGSWRSSRPLVIDRDDRVAEAREDRLQPAVLLLALLLLLLERDGLQVRSSSVRAARSSFAMRSSSTLAVSSSLSVSSSSLVAWTSSLRVSTSSRPACASSLDWSIAWLASRSWATSAVSSSLASCRWRLTVAARSSRRSASSAARRAASRRRDVAQLDDRAA